MIKPVFHDSEEVLKLRESMAEMGYRLPEAEPDWESLLKPLTFPFVHDREAVRSEMTTYLRRIWTLRFADHQDLTDHVIFNYTKLPEVCQYLQHIRNPYGLRLCALFQFLIKMATQGNSVFPGNPTRLAERVREVIQDAVNNGPSHPTDTFLDLLADLFVGEPVEFRDGKLKYRAKSGANFDEVSDPNSIALWEHQYAHGKIDEAICQSFKYRDHERKVSNREFRADWNAIRRCFQVDQFQHEGRILRSGFRAVNSKQIADPVDVKERQQFHATFDFFCWKWFLRGMEGNRPLVEGIRYKLTPFGTQIFIPGYWSVDFKKDSLWKKTLAKLHKARGVTRQGEGLADIREAHEAELKKVFREEKKARAQGLTGAALCNHLIAFLRRAPDTDHSQIRALIREARKTLGRDR